MTKSAKLLSVAALLAVGIVTTLAIVMIGDSDSNGSGPTADQSASAAQLSAKSGPYRSRPDLEPPPMKIIKDTAEASNQKLFIGSKVSGAIIYDANGEPIWFRPARAINFRKQTYRGKPVITWFEGPSGKTNTRKNTYMIANRNYKIIKRVYPGPGFSADSHEFRLTKRGTAFVTIYDTKFVNGRAVSDSIAQEIDVRTGRVVWQWRSLDHVPISDSFVSKFRKPGNPFDYFHINSIVGTSDGNILISGRGPNAVYKVSRRTGRIIWQLGGKRSDFKMGKRAAFHQQHDAQMISKNKISIFDNSTSPTVSKKWAKQSRGLVLKLNFKKKKAVVAQEFFNPAKPLATQQGNMQKLKNGNYLVGWGGVPLLSEHAANGKVVFDAELLGIRAFYRAYRDSWSGRAPGKVAVAAFSSGSDQTNAFASWNGDTRVREWRIMAGGSRKSLSNVGTYKRDGFETRMEVPGSRNYVKVIGLSKGGKSIGSSRVVKVR